MSPPPLICMQTCLYHHEGLRINVMKQGRSRYNMSPPHLQTCLYHHQAREGGGVHTQQKTHKHS